MIKGKIIICDHCGNIGMKTKAKSPAGVRRSAKRRGWFIRQNDMCPPCYDLNRQEWVEAVRVPGSVFD